MNKKITFETVQKLEAAAAEPPPRAKSDSAAIRASLIASRVLRPANDTSREPPRPGVFSIDAAGISEAARTIAASRIGSGRFAEVLAHADPRVAASLQEIAVLRGMQLEAA